MGVPPDVVRANRRPFWSKAGETPAPTPTPHSEAGLTGYNAEGVLNPHNNDRGSRMPDRTPEKTQFHRGRQSIDAGGARLSISPSNKIPTDDLPSGYNHRPKLVQSRAGAGNGSASLFAEAQYSTQRG